MLAVTCIHQLCRYEDKLADLEQERHSIEQEKAEQVRVGSGEQCCVRTSSHINVRQVGRSKELLQKQRNIMVALTERLNERDEQIIELQEELDAYDRRQKVRLLHCRLCRVSSLLDFYLFVAHVI